MCKKYDWNSVRPQKEVEACVSSIKWFNHRSETGSDSVVEKKKLTNTRMLKRESLGKRSDQQGLFLYKND